MQIRPVASLRVQCMDRQIQSDCCGTQQHHLFNLRSCVNHVVQRADPLNFQKDYGYWWPWCFHCSMIMEGFRTCYRYVKVVCILIRSYYSCRKRWCNLDSHIDQNYSMVWSLSTHSYRQTQFSYANNFFPFLVFYWACWVTSPVQSKDIKGTSVVMTLTNAAANW